MSQPFVSVICPTTHARKSYNEAILNTFILQDYIGKELLWDYEPGTIGEKRNRLCEKSRGEAIIHCDCDDMYAPDWITRSVKALQENDADIVGLSTANFYDAQNREAYQYKWQSTHANWVCGATMAYRRSFWEKNRFPDIQIAEDSVFCSRTRKIFDHGYTEGFLASIHEGNTSKRNTDQRNWRRLNEQEENELRTRWKLL